MKVIKLTDLEIKNKTILVREDLNVPVKNGRVTSDARIRAALPTINYILEQGGRLILMSHLGRPEEGIAISEQSEFSMAPVADHLAELTGKKVRLVVDYLDGFEHGEEDIVLFENVRVNKGESKNNDELAIRLAKLCDIFVMDAFGTAHRAQATTHGVAKYAPIACAGPLLVAELEALEKALANPEHPVVAIVGGSKVSTKLEVLDALSAKVDTLIVGGGIANTFLAATGREVGKSLCEHDLKETARELLQRVNIPLPLDVIVATQLSDDAIPQYRSADEVGSEEMILDIGVKTSDAIDDIIKTARTIIWNGPVGVFENDNFAEGTKRLTMAIAANTGFSIAGGGDTLAAIDKYEVADKVSYISTGGGAFLEFVEGKILPAVEILESRAADK